MTTPHKALLTQALDALQAALSDDQPYIERSVAAIAALQAAIDAPEPEPVPPGKVLVPIRMTLAMQRVCDQDDWEWADVLAAANAVTESEYADALEGAAGAAPVPEDWRSAVAMAYGHLWHIDNEPMDPIPLRSEESAAYAARKLLRDLLTTEERGEAINSVRAMLTASPKEPT